MLCFQDIPYSPRQIRTIIKDTARFQQTHLLPLCPEQAAVWSYPMVSGDKEEVVFNMINAMMLRIHQSGHLVNIEPERKALVKKL